MAVPTRIRSALRDGSSRATLRAIAESERNAVTLRVRVGADLVDRADVTRREVQRDEAVKLRYPNAARLDVHVLPALRLDVRVRDVLRLELTLPSDVTLRHGQ